MIPCKAFVLLIAVAVIGGACAPQQKYHWGNYEEELYGYYKDPEQLEAFMEALGQAIANAEEGQKEGPSLDGKNPAILAPGLYAEYGYLLMIKNQPSEARRYFVREKETWPESAVLMEKMIAVIDRSSASPSTKGLFSNDGTAK